MKWDLFSLQLQARFGINVRIDNQWTFFCEHGHTLVLLYVTRRHPVHNHGLTDVFHTWLVTRTRDTRNLNELCFCFVVPCAVQWHRHPTLLECCTRYHYFTVNQSPWLKLEMEAIFVKSLRVGQRGAKAAFNFAVLYRLYICLWLPHLVECWLQ